MRKCYIVFHIETEKLEVYSNIKAISQNTLLTTSSLYYVFSAKKEIRYVKHGYVIHKKNIIKSVK